MKKILLGLFLILGLISANFAQALSLIPPDTVARTSDANVISSTTATINGIFWPEDMDNDQRFNSAYFQYGAGVAPNIKVTAQAIPTLVALPHGESMYQGSLTGLSPNTTYNYNFVVVVEDEDNGHIQDYFGSTKTFTTLPSSSSSVQTLQATSVTTVSAMLNGAYYPQFDSISQNPTSFHFEYGNTPALGSAIAANAINTLVANPDGSTRYIANISGLTPIVTYYYRFVNGPIGPLASEITVTPGQILSFTTLPPTGVPMPSLFAAVLYFGSYHPEVIKLQLCLRAITSAYGASTPITGGFYTRTDAAVREFQAAHGIPAIGIVGPLTRAALNIACPAILNGGASAATQ